MDTKEQGLYRLNVGIMLINAQGLVWVGQRLDSQGWQMPQGGIDDGETDLVQGALRELFEETGIQDVEIVYEHPHWLTYDLPPYLQKTLWGGGYLGQKQKWFLMRFLGDDGQVNLNVSDHPEFGTWRWCPMTELPDLAVDFKRPVYEQVVRDFQDKIVFKVQ